MSETKRNSNGKKSVVLKISARVHKKLKLAAVAHDTSMADIASKAVEQWLRAN